MRDNRSNGMKDDRINGMHPRNVPGTARKDQHDQFMLSTKISIPEISYKTISIKPSPSGSYNKSI
jgi:putative lipoic acid-binding regulatory protein